MEKFPKILAKRVVAESRIFKVEEVDLHFKNGHQCTYERTVSRAKHAVMAVPLLDENTVLLMREFATGTERYELALPKGMLEEGEDPFMAANREMMEEVGYGANKLSLLKELTAIPGYMTGSMFCIVGQDLYPERLPGDEPEEIEVVPWRLDKLNELAIREDVTEARSIAALYMVREWLAGKL